MSPMHVVTCLLSFHSCTSGWTGNDCSSNINECQVTSNLCQNGGTCHDQAGSYICSCVSGWKGRNCEINEDDCVPNPCLNNGTCIDKVARYECQCPSSHAGTFVASCLSSFQLASRKLFTSFAVTHNVSNQ